MWKWIFWDDGKRVAFEDGPPHFMMRCVLADVATGKKLKDVDCFGELAAEAPEWARELEASQ